MLLDAIKKKFFLSGKPSAESVKINFQFYIITWLFKVSQFVYDCFSVEIDEKLHRFRRDKTEYASTGTSASEVVIRPYGRTRFACDVYIYIYLCTSEALNEDRSLVLMLSATRRAI